MTGIRALLLVASACAGAALAPRAAAQDPARVPPPSAATADSWKLRGVLQWRRAVWTLERAAFRKAGEELYQARQIAGERADHTTVFLLGLSITYAGDPAKGLEFIQQSEQMSPRFPGALLARAVAEGGELAAGDTKGQLAVAARVEEYLKAVALLPRDAPFTAELEFLGYFELGRRYDSAERYDEAIAAYTRAIAVSKGAGHIPSPRVVRPLAQAHKSVNQAKEATKLIRESLERDPGETSNYYLLGQIVADEQDFAGARAWYERAAAHRPDYAEARAKLAYVAHAEADLHRMRVQLESYQALLEKRWVQDPRSRTRGQAANIRAGFGLYWQARGQRLTERGETAAARVMYERARDEYRRAILEEPTCLRALNGLVQMLYRLDAPEEDSLEYRKRIDELTRPGLRPYADTFC